MSATFNTSTFSAYFNNCTNIEVQGTLFPVTEFYLEDVLEETKFANFPEEVQRKRPKWEKYRNKYKVRFMCFNRRKLHKTKLFTAKRFIGRLQQLH